MIALVGGLGVVGLGLAHRAQVWQPAYVRPLWPVYPQIAAPTVGPALPVTPGT